MMDNTITLRVPEKLTDRFGLTECFVSTTDPLHLAGTADIHIKKDERFLWMVKLFGTSKEFYNKFNWGKLCTACRNL